MDEAAASSPSVPRELARILRRHPSQLPERLIRFAVERLGEPTRRWAAELRARPDADIDARCAALARETIVASRVDGAVSGTPFLIALVPAYVTFLWTQARMTLRIAALQGRDPTHPGMAAELLALRGVYPTVAEAADALARLDEQPPAPAGWGERLVVWTQLVRRILVLAAFASPRSPDAERRPRARGILVGAIGGLIWIGTWVFPITFMLVMAWSCEHSSRELAAAALDYFGAAVEPGAPRERRLARARGALASLRAPRQLVWGLAAWLSLAVPLLLIALAVSHLRHGDWVRFVAPLAGLALVLGLARRIARAA